MTNYCITVVQTRTGVLYLEAESEASARSQAEIMGNDGAVEWDEKEGLEIISIDPE